MLVKDIYGGDYDKLGLDNNLIASTLGDLMKYLNDINVNFV